MKTIRIKVNNASLLRVAAAKAKTDIINEILNIVNSQEFIEHLAGKIRAALDEIAKREVGSINNEALDGIGREKEKYFNSMGMEVKGNMIVLYNDSKINLDEKKLKPSTRIRYPLQLSLASIIEYGIGYTGAKHSIGEAEGWEYDVRNHGQRGWYYIDSLGNVHWTNGLAGRYIFLKLRWWVEQNIKGIISDYINDKL